MISSTGSKGCRLCNWKKVYLPLSVDNRYICHYQLKWGRCKDQIWELDISGVQLYTHCILDAITYQNGKSCRLLEMRVKSLGIEMDMSKKLAHRLYLNSCEWQKISSKNV